MNTVTSPQQSGLRRLLALTREEELPPSLLTMGLMQGLTNARSTSAAKDKAREVADAKSAPVVTTAKTDPATGRTTVDVKGLVLGDGQAEVDAAYEIPQVELAEQLAPYAQQFGHKIPGGGDLKEKMGSFWGRYHLARELGTGRLRSLIRSGAIEARPEAREQAASEALVRDVDRQRLVQAVQDFKFASPVIGEADRQRRMDTADSKEERLRQKETRSILGRTIAATDFTMLDEGDWVSSIAQQNGVAPEDIDDATRAQIERTGRQQIKRVHDSRFNAFRQDNAIGQYDTFEKVKAAFGESLSPKEATQLEADWREKRTIIARAEKDSAQRDARFLAFVERVGRATAEKPVTFRAGDAQAIDADELVEYIGAENVDQRSLKLTMQRRVSLLSKQFDTLSAEAAAVVDEYNNLLPRIATAKARFEANEYAPAAATHYNRLEDRKAALEQRKRELDQLRKPLVDDIGVLQSAIGGKRRAPAAPAGGATFTPPQEAGIAAYMKAAGYSDDKRAQAIKELQAKGKLPK